MPYSFTVSWLNSLIIIALLGNASSQIFIHVCLFFNTYYATGLFLYAMKTSESFYTTYVFRWCRKRPVVWNALMFSVPSGYRKRQTSGMKCVNAFIQLENIINTLCFEIELSSFWNIVLTDRIIVYARHIFPYILKFAILLNLTIFKIFRPEELQNEFKNLVNFSQVATRVVP